MLIQKQFNKKNLLDNLKKKLDTDDNATNAGNNDESMFVLTISGKVKETRLNFIKD